MNKKVDINQEYKNNHEVLDMSPQIKERYKMYKSGKNGCLLEYYQQL
ncbi:MAG: KxYKxGKxW signal peptide domain-containing protein [Lactobacillaceae bacterium]|jgi:hypothetical protein|nr:KxYKxGKxW signal peptide domain-containing protein [Lactobacillaceae bacterium]